MNNGKLTIIQWPDPRLREVATPVTGIDTRVRWIASEMIRLMRLHKGIGLAANQVGEPIQMIVSKVPKYQTVPEVYINPVIVPVGTLKFTDLEGCLSLQWGRSRCMVTRWNEITMSYLNLRGEPRTADARGLLARCWQHEVDHLRGINLLNRRSL